MLSEQEVKQALHASRVVLMDVPNTHGPLGSKHLALTLARFLTPYGSAPTVVKSIEIPSETWQKLEQLAAGASRSESRPVSVAEVASAIVQSYLGHQRT